jgi:hypothetical protein
MEVKLRKLNKVFRRMDTELPIMENKDALDSTPTLNPQFTVTIRGRTIKKKRLETLVSDVREDDLYIDMPYTGIHDL